MAGERPFEEQFTKKFGDMKITIPVDDKGPDAHMKNFLDCVRTREKPVLDALTGYKALVTIELGVQSYRQGRVMYFDEEKQKVVDKPAKTYNV